MRRTVYEPGAKGSRSWNPIKRWIQSARVELDAALIHP